MKGNKQKANVIFRTSCKTTLSPSPDLTGSNSQRLVGSVILGHVMWMG